MSRNLKRHVVSALGVLGLGLLMVGACQSYDLQEVSPKPPFKAANEPHPITGKMNPAKVMVVVDKSKSMVESVEGLSQPACTTPDGDPGGTYDPDSPNLCKWNSLKDAFASPDGGFFVKSSALARFGLAVFPDPTASTMEETPDGGVWIPNCESGKVLVQVGSEVGDTVGQIREALDAIVPSGGTPTAQILLSLIDSEHPADPVFAANETNTSRFVMLLTDGSPNCNSQANQAKCEACVNDETCYADGGCRPTSVVPRDWNCSDSRGAEFCLDEDSTVSAVRALREKGTYTFVIGFGQATSDPSSDAARVLNRAAEEGGQARTPDETSSLKFYQANSVTQLVQILQKIKDTIQACDFTLETAPLSENVLQVILVDSQQPEGSRETVLQKGTFEPASGDWAFKDATTVRIHNPACEMLQNASPNRYAINFLYAGEM